MSGQAHEAVPWGAFVELVAEEQTTTLIDALEGHVIGDRGLKVNTARGSYRG